MVRVDEKISVAFKLFDDMVEEEEDMDEPFEDEEDRLTFLFEVKSSIRSIESYSIASVGGRVRRRKFL